MMKKLARRRQLNKLGILIVILILVCKTVSYAAEFPALDVELEEGITPVSGLMQTNKYTQGYERPDTQSTIVTEIAKGQSVMVSGMTEDGWFQVVYQGKRMYVEKDYLEEDAGSEALQNEMSELEKLRASEAVHDIQTRKEILRGRIWGAVIMSLIAGIFIVGIIAVIRSDKEDEEKEADKEEMVKQQEDISEEDTLELIEDEDG